jgi:DNA primase catalytic core
MIEQAEIERIKRETDLAQLVAASGVRLKRKGKQLVGLCPFHDDHEPSLIVDPKKQLWNCLGACGVGGDVYRWVMQRDGLDFKAAHQLLSAGRHAGSSTQTLAGGTQAEAPVSAADLQWLDRAVEHYHRCLLSTPRAQDYLRSRGITAAEFATAFRVGYADGSLLEVISPAGQAALQRLGVLTETGRELLSGCVIFPLLEAASGQVVNLYGRHTERAQHLYLPGARRGVFNPQGAQQTDEVILTESVIDAAAAWSVGLRNVLPVYGVHGLTEELVAHLQACRVQRVTLLLDSDDAGQHAALLLEQRLRAAQFTAQAVLLPVKDASEFIAAGGTGDELRALIAPAHGAGPVAALGAAVELEKLPEGVLRYVLGGREYRVRGLSPVGLERLKVNLRLSVNGTFHLDTLDLYQARARAAFAQTAAKLCRVEEQQVSADLLALIEPLEQARLQMKPTTSQAEAAPLTASEKAAALAFLQAPDLCARIVADFKRCGFEGERETVLTAYLAAVSRKLGEPLGVLIIARSGAGKSALQDAVCGFVPPEDLVRVTRLTGQALFYKDPDSLKQKLLAIAEEEGAAQAVYSLRTLASDQQLSIAATRTDPQTGKLHTEHYEVHGPVSIIITTTSPEAFDEETRSRFVPLTLDESEAQTKAILERQRRRYSLAGTLERKEAEAVRRLHHHAQRLLRPLEVINPFGAALSYPSEKLIHRREQQKYLALINAIALLHQYQREVQRAVSEESGVGFEYVEVTLDDLALANELTVTALARALDELAPPVRGLYQEFCRLCESKAQELGCAVDAVQLSRREIREATGWSDWQVRVYCQQLLELEYLTTASGANGKRFVYELAFYRPEGDGPPKLRGLVDVAALRKQQLQQLKKNPQSTIRNPQSANLVAEK